MATKRSRDIVQKALIIEQNKQRCLSSERAVLMSSRAPTTQASSSSPTQTRKKKTNTDAVKTSRVGQISSALETSSVAKPSSVATSCVAKTSKAAPPTHISNEITMSNVETESIALTSKAPSLTESQQRTMDEVFQTSRQSVAVPHTTANEKCKSWIESNSELLQGDASPRVVHNQDCSLVPYTPSPVSVYNMSDQSTHLTMMQPVSLNYTVGDNTSVDYPKVDINRNEFSLQDECILGIDFNTAPTVLVTPPESTTVLQNYCPPNVPHDTDGISLKIVSALPNHQVVKRKLFPSDPSEIQELGVLNLPVNDVDSAFLPLEEPNNIPENVIPPAVIAEVSEEDSLDVQTPETEERNVIQNKTRKRTSMPTDKTPARKRKVVPENWIRTKAKVAYNAGLSHTSKAGQPKKAKSLKPPCTEKCRMKCFSRVSHELREQLFQKYWSLKQEKTSQWLFLAKLASIVNIKERTVEIVDGEDPFRKHSYDYTLRDLNCEEDSIPVCQTMFINTFDISPKAVKTALKKNSPDKRGKHSNHKKISTGLVENVKEHIKKFPLVQSHYCRADTQKGYLNENLSVAQMHRMYVLERGNDELTANERQYRDIFNTCFNLSFFKPKKDQCSFCITFDALDAEKTEEKIIEYNEHHREKKRVRELKKEDKELSKNDGTSNIRVATFDLQKILYCPKGENAEFYYKRKLSSFNFTIMDCTDKQAYCYVWDLTIGRKGADEVASFVFDYIKAMVEKGINDFRFYSDSCTGQNKNRYLFCMYYLAAMKFNIKITHTWLVKGHTQMECDNVHARIEKKTKHLEIFTPSQWYGAIRSAKVKRPAYIVKEAGKDVTIFTFRPLDDHFNWAKVPVTKLRRLTVESGEPFNVLYQTECDGVATKQRILIINKVGRPVNWTTIKLKKAYSGKLPLKPKLVNDLKWYVEKGFVPAAYLDFYRYLIEEPAANTVELDEDEDEEDDVPQEIILSGNQQNANETNVPENNGALAAPVDRHNDEMVASDGDVSNEEDDDFD